MANEMEIDDVEQYTGRGGLSVLDTFNTNQTCSRGTSQLYIAIPS